VHSFRGGTGQERRLRVELTPFDQWPLFSDIVL
jgi:hypothetical protein